VNLERYLRLQVFLLMEEERYDTGDFVSRFMQRHNASRYNLREQLPAKLAALQEAVAQAALDLILSEEKASVKG
jgi:hypothetical protein